MLSRIVITIAMLHMPTLASSRARSGAGPRPFLDTQPAPMMKPKLSTPQSTPQNSTETRVRP